MAEQKFIKAISENSENPDYPDCLEEWEYYMSSSGEDNCICGKKKIHQLYYIKNMHNDKTLIVGSDCIKKYASENEILLLKIEEVVNIKRKKTNLLEKLHKNEKIIFNVGNKSYQSSYNENIYSIPLTGKRSIEKYKLIKSMFPNLNICFNEDKRGYIYIKVYYKNDMNKYLEVNNNKISVRFRIVNNHYLNAHIL